MHHSEDCTGEVSSETTVAHGLHQPVSCVCGTLSVGGLHTPAKAIASFLIACQQRTRTRTRTCTCTRTHTHTHTHTHAHTQICHSCSIHTCTVTPVCTGYYLWQCWELMRVHLSILGVGTGYQTIPKGVGSMKNRLWFLGQIFSLLWSYFYSKFLSALAAEEWRFQLTLMILSRKPMPWFRF